MQFNRILIFIVALVVLPSSQAHAEQVLRDGLTHVRIEGPREWTEFSDVPGAEDIDIKFESSENQSEATLVVQQQDVKQRWNVAINGKQIGRLRVNENDMLIYFSVPANVLREGGNTLRIEQATQRDAVTDDVRIGNIQLLNRKVEDVLSDASCELTVVESKTGKSLPSRITILNSDGALQTVGATSGDNLAVRPGTIYTSNGSATFGLPAGNYTIYAGRGFEYSVDSIQIKVTPGQSVRRTLKLVREVPTEGLVACDTHVHTLTHSGHGDATAEERMITLAAEGIELPVATDHNVHVDHRPFAQRSNVSQYFTPIIGNEVTSRIGHVNIFPVKAGTQIPDHKLTSWKGLLDDIFATPNVRVAILNHARDVHTSVTPFGPRLHNAAVGENLEGWHFGFNAMEVVNSSSTQTDILQLFHDWMAVLNRGYQVTPVGSSDSHDVGRHFVGQGRTYIRCDDSDPGNINVSNAVDSFLEGKVSVSYGLLTKLIVGDSCQSGDTATADGDTVQLRVHVLGPHWTHASKILLYRNGQEIASRDISKKRADLATGVKAVEDGKATSAHEYARDLFMDANGDLDRILKSLEDFDEATAIQAAHMVQQAGTSLLDESNQAAIRKASPETRRGIRQYLDAWRESQMAQASQ